MKQTPKVTKKDLRIVGTDVDLVAQSALSQYQGSDQFVNGIRSYNRAGNKLKQVGSLLGV